MARVILWTKTIVVAASLAGSAQSAVAQDSLKPLDRPDPASVSVPDVSAAPKPGDARDYDVYFYFYKAGVSYKTAFADLDECRMYALTTKSVAVPPGFVPLGSDVIQGKATPVLMSFGPVGAIVGSIFIEQDRRDTDRATTKRCMAYKGYSRYGASQSGWKAINTGSDAEKIAREALIASGPKPAAEAIDP
jgi:hypothetical protein